MSRTRFSLLGTGACLLGVVLGAFLIPRLPLLQQNGSSPVAAEGQAGPLLPHERGTPIANSDHSEPSFPRTTEDTDLISQIQLANLPEPSKPFLASALPLVKRSFQGPVKTLPEDAALESDVENLIAQHRRLSELRQDFAEEYPDERTRRVIDVLEQHLADPEGFVLALRYEEIFGPGLPGGPGIFRVGLYHLLSELEPASQQSEFSTTPFQDGADLLLASLKQEQEEERTARSLWYDVITKLGEREIPAESSEPDVEVTKKKPREIRPLDPAFAEKAGQRIWESECNGTKIGLTSWNRSEPFASLGIGHFLWFPAGLKSRFEESFPAFIAYCRQVGPERLGAEIPAWLLETEDCPWNTYEEFQSALDDDPRMISLRDFLFHTVPIQTEFIYDRLLNSKAKIVESAAEDLRETIASQFDTLLTTPEGFFAMLDYVNFKGEGTNPEERFKGEGWGLLQVLERMPPGVPAEKAHVAFGQAAKEALENRVRNNPPDKQYITGWTRRVLAYQESFGDESSPDELRALPVEEESDEVAPGEQLPGPSLPPSEEGPAGSE